ncbi:MAG: PAS domain S-box protein [Betaproteobacteria bacterium]|nr:PAS domain S-box protein [Betaproteobacteria bacterium]
MNRSSPKAASSLKATLRKIELPWFVLAALLISTLFTAYQNARQVHADAQTRFQEIAQGEQAAIVRHLRDFEDLMHGTSALMVALPNLGQSAWDAFFDTWMPVPENYAGLVALQYVPTLAALTPSAASTASLTRVFSPTRPGQQVAPLNKLPEIADAIALADSGRRTVMSRPLADTPGLPTMQSPVALVMIAGNDGSARSLAGRSTIPRGYLIAIIDLNLLMSHLAQTRSLPVTLELYDGDRRVYAPTEILTASIQPEMSVDAPVEFGQRTFRLRTSSTPRLESKLQNNTPRTILLIGVLGAILLGGLIWLLTSLREQAEALAASMTRKLQEQTKFTEDLIEFNPSPIFRKDNEGRFLSVNRAWEQLAGRKREDVLGKMYHDFQAEDAARQNEQLDRKLLESESGYEMAEAFITNADNKQFETIIAKQVLRSSDGRAEGLIGTITDVTPIKRLERELAQQREQLSLVIRSSQQGIWDVELKPDGATYFSPRFREILGYAEDEYPVTFDWRATIHPDDRIAFQQRMISHYKGETPLFDIESRARSRDGNYRWVRCRGIAQRDSTGWAVRFVGSISDVTDRKIAEMNLVEANVRVMQASRAKEAFLATMSHEIRTPLNGVLGMTSLLTETPLNDEQHDYIRLIRASGDTLLRLIDDVLDFSKIESGHMALESVPVEVVLVAEEAFELVAEKAREKNLALLFEMNDDVPFYILGDATRLRQILLNLLSNAIKFTAKGEIKLTLSTRQTSDGKMELEGQVRDTGIGIPADRACKLFQPFTQVDTSTTRKYGGTGLGLAICKRLTQLMGGEIRVESIEGEGSVFIFTILTEPVRGPLKPYMQRDVVDFVGKRLLVVDRNASRRSIQMSRYSRWGFETVTVAPEHAADVFQRGPRFDVLLTDMVLPTPESITLQAVLAEDDAARTQRGERLVASVMQSTLSRAELSARGIRPLLRHEIFLVRPAGRARLFDVLRRAVLREPHVDIATRPYTPEPVYDRDFQAAAQANPQKSRQTFGAALGVGPSSAPMLNTLIAEDNEVNQRVIQGMLTNLGHRSTVVGDGRSAVERASKEDFDLVLMDIHMPELDGVEAMQEIRKNLKGKKCPPIVAMTAHALAGDREQYLDAGMDDYLSKPIRTADLVKLLDRVTSRTKVAPPAKRDGAVVIRATANPSPANPRIDNIAILDIEQLQDLRYLPAVPGETIVENDPVGGLIRLFQTKAIERMKLMEGLLAASNWHSLSETSHSLRGASASMGFPRVALLCKDLELAARSLADSTDKSSHPENGADLAGLLEQINRHYAEAEQALTEWLAATPHAPVESANRL